jgi:hypothetical protein
MTTPVVKLHVGGLARAMFGLCMWAAIGAIATPAHAALGDDVAAVEQDRVRMQASLQVHRKATYDVHELATAIGTTVRELVNQNGKVFAVSWSGGWRPNLRDVMGAHYDRFIASTRGKRRARGPVRIELPGMVVFMGTYLRTSFGYVYLTEELPAGFSSKEIE